MGTKSKFSRQQLHDSLVHIRYTVDQILATLFWQRMESGFRFKKRLLTKQEEAIFANACIDSSLCSLRILDEFFGKPHKDVITANEFGFREVDLLDGPARKLINNHVSHLTHKRVKESILEIPNHLFRAAFVICTEFLEHLVETFLNDDDAEMAPVSEELDAFRSARKRFKF